MKMANAIGIHLSFWQTSWDDPLLPLILKAKQSGFDVAEFPLLDPKNLDYHSLKEELDRLEMRASCSTGLGPETDITHPDPRVREQGLDYLFACLEGARILASPILAGVTYAPWAVFPEDDLAKRREHCIQSLKIAAGKAEELGIMICMEVLNRFEGYLINTVEQAAEIIEEVGSPNLKIQLDTFHLNIEADSFGDSIREAGSDLGHFHCVANNRKPPGAGHIPWEEVRSALNEISYEGYLVAEIFVNPQGPVGRGLFIWRDLAEDLDLAAQQAADFINSTFG
jgi:D-psicose/D-tagatose/L-ribulose 3-epimerase